jgi:energy-coupling factor transporter ATP-binding protein EcfA2
MGKLNFRSITIRKAPGFRNGLKSEGLDKLSPGINIITGPNGSGKSTIARIIRRLIWPAREKGFDIEGTYELDGSPWIIRVEPSDAKVQRDGIDAIPSGIPTGDLNNTYMLALHELVAEDDSLLAKKIMEASIGGYDLDLANRILGYSPLIKTRGNDIPREYNKARDNLAKTTNNQKALKGQENSLSELERQRDEARIAAALKDFYVKAAEYLKAKQELTNVDSVLGRYPVVLDKAAGNEFEQIKEYDKDIIIIQDEIEDFRKKVKDKQEVIDDLAIPEEGINDQVISELDQRITELKDLETRINDCNVSIARLKAEEVKARTKIINIQNTGEWKGMNLQELEEIDSFFQDALTIIQNKLSLEAEIKRLEEEPQVVHIEKKRLNEAIIFLGKWLKEGKTSNGIPLWILILISFIGTITALVTHFAGIIGLSGIAVIIAILIFTFIRGMNSGQDNSLTNRQNDFKDTGLSEPEKWETESVAARLHELTDELAIESQREAFERIWKGQLMTKKEDLRTLEDKVKSVNKKREELLARLNTMPDFPSSTVTTNSSLYIFLDQLKKWQSSDNELSSETGALEEINNQRIAKLAVINDLFGNIGANNNTDAVNARSVYTKVKEDERIRRETVHDILNLNNNISDRLERTKTLQYRADAIYHSLGIENRNYEAARKLMEQFPDYALKKAEKHSEETTLGIKRIELEGHHLFADHENEISNLQLYEAEANITKFEAEASHLEEISSKIAGINALVDDKMIGDELEKALSEMRNAEARLENFYESNLSSITGALLMEHLMRETGEENRPEVFRRADRILGQITRGRYQLRLSGEGDPQFIAYDTILNQGMSIGELSTGTRVQLLIAIRLAFIELQEKDVKLPVIADELMANSDDMRAEAIIEALSVICAEGRQVFYFTAQPEEVAKWDTYLKKTKNISYSVLLLSGKSDYSTGVEARDFADIRAQFVYNPPEPGKSNIREYRNLLGKIHYNLLYNKPDQLSLSFLTTDVNLLYNCLKSGVGTWGQLRSFWHAGGRIKSIDDKAITGMERKTELLDQFQELYCIGRPKAVDMEVILASEAVTETFIDAVRKKLAEVNGDPIKLLESLETIKRFRAESIRQLENYLREKKHIDDNDPLGPDEIMIRMQALISTSETDPEEAQQFLNGILENV